jgi:nitrite reductase/ring-hydroxylating ferredoxin subunit/DMSO/TMAO reductase YedYZ heme-binding membrane subunit
MSVGYQGVQWTPHKKVYDLVLTIAVLGTVGAFALASALTHPYLTAETLIVRGTALTAVLLLHVILAIGPLARLDRRFSVLLYNRRHLGVVMFFLALVHSAFAILQFGAFGQTNAVVSLLGSYRQDWLPGSLAGLAHIPFELFGFLALGILFLMAATSHDFWLKNLGASFWKTLHILVLAAYGLLILHVVFGVLQTERSGVYPVLLGVGLCTILGLHLAAARKEKGRDRALAMAQNAAEEEGYVAVCRVAEVVEGRGKVVWAAGQRRAVFRHGGKLFGLSNVCRHQGGPLGEGKIVDGCITCPWHGWQYKAEDGCSPPPFEEVVETYPVRVVGERVYLHPEPHAPGTVSEGVTTEIDSAVGDTRVFYVGYLPLPASLRPFVWGLTVFLLVALPALAGLVAWAQKAQIPGKFEFGVAREFEGILHETPLPVLEVEAGQRFLLVGFGKQGLPDFARGHGGQRVRFQGSLTYALGRTMVEMNDPESFQIIGGDAVHPAGSAVVRHGAVTLVGELVDTKCFLGVMRPGEGKVHRACAIRCLEGGVPPGLLVRHEDGTHQVYLLAGPEGRGLDLDLRWAARTIEVEGVQENHGDLPVIRVAEVRLVD